MPLLVGRLAQSLRRRHHAAVPGGELRHWKKQAGAARLPGKGASLCISRTGWIRARVTPRFLAGSVLTAVACPRKKKRLVHFCRVPQIFAAGPRGEQCGSRSRAKEECSPRIAAARVVERRRRREGRLGRRNKPVHGFDAVSPPAKKMPHHREAKPRRPVPTPSPGLQEFGPLLNGSARGPIWRGSRPRACLEGGVWSSTRRS